MNILTTIVIAACAGLFILAFFKWKGAVRDGFILHSIFERLVRENKLLIYYKDVLNKRLIGFDKQKKKLLLLNVNKHDKLSACIGMDEIDSCEIVYLKDELSRSPEKVFIELVRKENNQPIRFCFYDALHDDMQHRNTLLLKARHWNQRINFHKKYWWIHSKEYAV